VAGAAPAAEAAPAAGAAAAAAVAVPRRGAHEGAARDWPRLIDMLRRTDEDDLPLFGRFPA
jgi:hypothetical protein